MKRKIIRYAFLALFAFLPLQYAVVGLVGLTGLEPWPAVVLPGFKNVWDQGSRISIPAADFRIYFDDGTIAVAEPRAILSPIPASHHLAVMRRQFCPASISGTGETERGALPGTRDWLARRIAALFPEKNAVRVDVDWRRLDYRSDGTSPASVPIDTLHIDLY